MYWYYPPTENITDMTNSDKSDSDGRAVSFLIENQLQQVCDSIPQHKRPSMQRVHIDCYSDQEVNKLASMANDGQLYIIADEVQGYTRSSFKAFLDMLSTKVQSLSVWCASVQKLSDLPTWMSERELTVPLRTPPVVTREVNNSSKISSNKYVYNKVNKYTIPSTPAATDGPEITWLRHAGQPGHDKGTPVKCTLCGHNIAHRLTELGVGQPGGLDYCDVFILTTSNDGKISFSILSGLIEGLVDKGIPVKVVNSNSDDDDKRDMALARENTVIASDFKTVSGLERRIVIGVNASSTFVNGEMRLYAMSRCTSQLVWIDGTSYAILKKNKGPGLPNRKTKKPQSEASKQGSPSEQGAEQDDTSNTCTSSQDMGSTPQSESSADIE